jgi:DNA-binding CsgD family transcriptional regulator
MQADRVIEVDGLTATENKVYCLNGVGKQTKEIADILKSSYETAKSHMKNIKAKLGLQKDKEVTAHFWCSLIGKDLDEVKRQIMASCLLIVFLLSIPFDQHQTRETRNFNNRARRTIVARRNEYTA